MSTATSQNDEKRPLDDKLPDPDDVGTMEYPSNQKRILIMSAVYLAMFFIILVSPHLVLTVTQKLISIREK